MNGRYEKCIQKFIGKIEGKIPLGTGVNNYFYPGMEWAYFKVTRNLRNSQKISNIDLCLNDSKLLIITL
jgi:hypothetical protein